MGKIEIKRIESVGSRQVSYSRRRKGMFKKANELSVLCDTKVSLLMLSPSGKLHEFIGPSTTSTKEIYDEYQKHLGVDIWESHYEKMQEDSKKLKETNENLNRQIRQRHGHSLNDLKFGELDNLEKEMESAVEVIRLRKNQLISNQISTKKKKIRNAMEFNQRLNEELDATEELQYRLVEVDSGIGHSSNHEDPHNLL